MIGIFVIWRIQRHWKISTKAIVSIFSVLQRTVYNSTWAAVFCLKRSVALSSTLGYAWYLDKQDRVSSIVIRP